MLQDSCCKAIIPSAANRVAAELAEEELILLEMSECGLS